MKFGEGAGFPFPPQTGNFISESRGFYIY